MLAAAAAVSGGCAARREQAAANAAHGSAQEQSIPAPAEPAVPAPVPAAVPPQSDPPASAGDLVAEGKARFRSYKCYECHGVNGEGTNDGPDLTGTRLNAAQIAAFLQHPSPDARSAGMPTIPAASADLQALVAFVVSLKRTSSPN